MPERSVNRPMRRAESPSFRLRHIGSKRRVRRESRWGTNRILWGAPGDGFDNTGWVVARFMGVAAALALALAWAAPPPDRLRLSIDKAREGVLVGVTEVSV